jgi:signal transduction histidine kinase
VTRRIVIAWLAFTAVVIGGGLLWLALIATAHDRSSFLAETEGMVRSDAAIAYGRLYDPNKGDPQLLALILQAKQNGDGLLITATQGPAYVNPVDQGMPPGNWAPLINEAVAAGKLADQARHQIDGLSVVQPITETADSRVIAAIPVFGPAQAPVIGTVILARSTAPLDSDIRGVWILFGSISLVAMILATLFATAFARWVSRPLKGLDAAAGRLADGDLASRAAVGSGPPELRRLGRTFNTMAGRLEALVHGHRAVIADVSHQLRTPLAALRLRLDLLAAESDPVTGGELAGALDELARLSRLVDGLLAVARAENVVPVPTAVDAAEVARERVVAWNPVADDRSILLTITLDPGLSKAGGAVPAGGPVMAWIGEGHLEQILDNLIANALDALRPGDRVAVKAAATQSGARITVSDNGPGMTAEERERAFLRFSTSNPNGTGLGLAIVHRLATSNGGTARMTETPGGGLTVTLDFPAVPAANGGAANGGAAGVGGAGGAAGGAGGAGSSAPGNSSPNPQAALSL